MTDTVVEPPLSTPPRIDEVVATLREDPVLVHSLFGNGDTDAVRSGLRDLVETADYPVYVVMVPAPAGLSVDDPTTDLATLLHDRLGDGLFVVKLDPQSYQGQPVGFGSSVPDYWAVRDEVEVAMPRREGDDRPPPLTAAAEVAAQLEWYQNPELASWERYETYATTAPWRGPVEPELRPYDDEALPDATAITLVFVVVAGVGWQVLRNAVRWRETAPPSDLAPPRGLAAAPPAELRSVADRELGRLAERLDEPVPDRDRRQLVDGCYDTARLLLDRAGDDVADLSGALVLIRTADRALPDQRVLSAARDSPAAPSSRRWRRRRSTRRERRNAVAAARRTAAARDAEEVASRLYRPCFLDPRHGEGTTTVPLPGAGGRQVGAPLCADCSEDPDRVTPLRVTERRRGRSRTLAYFETESVWARTGFGAFVDDLWRHVARDLEARR